MRKKKVIASVDDCSLHYYKDDVVAGLVFSTTLTVHLNTGEELSSEQSFSKISFKDFDVTVSGSGKIFFNGKRKLRIVSFYDAIDDPYINIKITMKERKDISKEVKIEILFKSNVIREA